MDNKNNNKSHNLKLLAVAALLILTPLVSTPLRLKYLYFIVNILVIAVGADAGLLSFLLQSAANKKPTAPAVEENVNVLLQSNNHNNITPDKNSDKTPHKCSADKNVDSVGAVKVDKSSSSPSLFIVEGSNTSIPADESIEDSEKATIPADELVEEVGESESESGVGPEEELFEKAEIFIGNFYKQLKMQREESWSQLHNHFSHKPS